MTREVTVARAEEIPPGEARVVEKDGLFLALFNVEGRFYVTDNTCLHRGGPLGDGFLEGTFVTCPWHGRRYDLETGENVGSPSLRVKTYPVIVEDGEVRIRI
jgi:nitrite reductase (NADH) small subunit/3-phenylpropionate/trans-cinnamate dioxygenase ferredoxin subunit